MNVLIDEKIAVSYGKFNYQFSSFLTFFCSSGPDMLHASGAVSFVGLICHVDGLEEQIVSTSIRVRQQDSFCGCVS